MECVGFRLRQISRQMMAAAVACILACLLLIATYPAGAVSAGNDDLTGAILLTDSTVRCPLREGQTTFIVSSQTDSALERLTFINENTHARGELTIAVSTDKISPNSAKWRPVAGCVHFDHKRLFNVSLLGIDARYVKLVFDVKREMHGTRLSPNRMVAMFSTIDRL